MSNYLKLEGGKELERRLLGLSTKVATKISRSVLRKAAREILLSARKRVPVNEGRLRRSLAVRVDRNRENRAMLEAVVYVSKRLGYEDRKTARRTMMRGRGQKRGMVDPGLGYQIGSRPDIYARFIEYGRHKQGVPARPFMRPAWDAEGGPVALKRIERLLDEEIAKAVQEMGRI